MDKDAFVQVLLAAQNSDPEIQKPAEEKLLAMERVDNLHDYYTLLGTVLSIESYPESARFMAIIRMKQTVTSRTASTQKQYDQRWLSQNATLRKNIHDLLLNVLTAPQEGIRKTAIDCVVAMASAEIPHNQWVDLLETSATAATNPQCPTALRCSAIEIIGEICKRLSSECQVLVEFTPKILYSILETFRSDELKLRIESVKALSNALKFCEATFGNESQRIALMTMMIQAVTPKPFAEATFELQFELQAAGWDCLINVVGYYYRYLTNHMMDIFNVSMAGIGAALKKPEEAPQLADEDVKSKTELAAIQVFEFWLHMATNEIDMGVEIEAAAANDEPCDLQLQKYCQHVSVHLVPLILQAMCLQPEDADDDSFNITMSALNLLQEFSKVLEGSTIFDQVIPAVRQSIQSPDWRFRDAACTALGSVLCSSYLDDENSGPVFETLMQALEPILSLVNDPELHVATSAAWALSQYAMYLHQKIVHILPHIFTTAIIPSLQHPRVRPIQNVCRVIYELCENLEPESENQPHPLAPWFEVSTNLLLHISETATDSTFLVNAYEALTELIHCGAGAQSQSLLTILQILGTRLQKATAQFDAANAPSYKTHTQGLICAALAASIRSLSVETVAAHVDGLYGVFASVLNSDPSVVIDALMGIEAIVYALEKQFAPRAAQTFITVVRMIANYKDAPEIVSSCFTLCGVIISCTGVLEPAHADEFAATILNILALDTSGEQAKLAAIDVIGDLALFLDNSFNRYYDHMIPSLTAALDYSLTISHADLDIDLVDYLLALQHSTCTALDAIVLSLCSPKDNNLQYAPLLAPAAEKLVSLCVGVASDTERTQTTLTSSLTLLLDLLTFMNTIHPDLAKRVKKNQELINVVRELSQKSRPTTIKKIALQIAKALAN